MKRTKIQSCVEFSQSENKENPNYLIYNESSGSLMGMSHERSRKTSTVTKKHKGETVSSVRRFSQTCLDNLPLRFKNRKSLIKTIASSNFHNFQRHQDRRIKRERLPVERINTFIKLCYNLNKSLFLLLSRQNLIGSCKQRNPFASLEIPPEFEFQVEITVVNYSCFVF